MRPRLPAGASTQTGATSGGGLLDGSCGSGTAPEDMFYWAQCPTAAGGTFDATTCNAATTYDTLIYLRSGVTGAQLACNDDAACVTAFRSQITATVPAGAGLFGFYVDGFSSDSGNYGAQVTRP